jgi:8-oxo-dGTP diphosphatase
VAKGRQVGVAVIVVVMTISEGALKILLVRKDDRRWALPNGQPRVDESLLIAANRVVSEQAGIKMDYLEQLYTFGDQIPDDRPRTIEVSYYGLVPSVLLRTEKLADRSAVNWFAEVEQPPLVANHKTVVELARDRLRGKLAYSAVGFELLPGEFTLAELQNLYEVILSKELDKRNFRRKINELGILEPTGKERSSHQGRGRPASLYHFKPEVFRKIETKGDIFPF